MTNSKGFSLVEAMLAAGVLSLIVTTLAGALVFGEQSSVGAGKRSRATELAEEGIEAVRSIRDQAFNELQYAQSGVTISSNTWAFLGEATSETIDEFTRTTNFADV
ncbi:MAG: prepilin-type N-terminal cleavage/methylation domain-containing protein, partial [Patescibacteria group bacterium]